jgi:uncharacterized protein YigE (DUF2233 family)
MPSHLRSISVLAAILTLTFGLLSRATPSDASESARVLDVRWRPDGGATAVTLKLSGPVRYRTMARGDQVSVDLWRVINEGGDRDIAIDGVVASRVFVRQMTPDMARVAIMIRPPARFKVHMRDDLMTVTVFPAWQSAVALPDSVSYQTLSVPTGRGQARAHVVTLDPQDQGIAIRPALGGAVVASTETTSAAAARLGALAAINGNYFTRAGLPIGLIVIDGRVLSAPFPRRAVFGLTDEGRPWIGATEFSGRAITDTGSTIPIRAVNRPPRAGGAALYTPEFGPLTFTQALIAIIRQDRVEGFASGRQTIPADGYALAVAASEQHLLQNFVRGQSIKVELSMSPGGLEQAIQGGPQLVRDGRVHIPYAWEGFRPGFYRLRAARSAVGITKTGKVLLVTADGPVAGRGGVTLEELAGLMHTLGSVDAMNLDGGGSATLVVGGRTVSRIPRGGERNVTSLLVAVPNPTARVAPRPAP